ncbi:hypothetical protein NLX83_20735 [Allokutzneria sp. A3M-2-11 16]|uniref:hypothetical protein n=1 Tax=Allokutzneria sp. A3M-2-11 16 TaxID=2962043 RepID=UPI0020B88DE5|nr:hypothetical protein [Allokutzneria sp. A3M-2-11 16]MCP3801693.1 hypothetical protein [Allokutzneria sp. A3M-2-11 16]
MTAWNDQPAPDTPYQDMRDSLDRVNAQLGQGITYDKVTADWVTKELTDMINIAEEEVRKAERFYDDTQRINLGKSQAGQAIRAKIIARASDQEGGALRFWIDYHKALITYRDKVAAMAREWERADRTSADNLPGSPR